MQLSDAKRERHPASLNRRRAARRRRDGRIATPFEIAVLLLGAARGRRPDSQLVGATNKMPEISVPSLRPHSILYFVLQPINVGLLHSMLL